MEFIKVIIELENKKEETKAIIIEEKENGIL